MVRALDRTGETPSPRARWNHGGYMRNVVEEIHVTAV
jgi:hypothetical protein